MRRHDSYALSSKTSEMSTFIEGIMHFAHGGIELSDIDPQNLVFAKWSV
jgi:kynurenine formamidase